MTQLENSVPVDKIIQPDRETHIINLEELRDYLKEREGYFINGLTELARLWSQEFKFNTGWQQISKDDTGLITKKAVAAGKDPVTEEPVVTIEENSLFTASEYCIIAVCGLVKGVREIIRANNLQDKLSLTIHVHSVAYNRENWPKGVDSEIAYHLPNHAFMGISDGTSTYYYDPTYAQIDHEEVGRFVITDADNTEELNKLYGPDFTSSKADDEVAAPELTTFYIDAPNPKGQFMSFEEIEKTFIGLAVPYSDESTSDRDHKIEKLKQLIDTYLVSKIAS